MAQYEIDNRQSPVNWECDNDPVMRAVQNAKNLLMLKMGEVPYDRYRGFDQKLYSLPISEFNEQLMPELDRVWMWEKDVELVSALGTITPDGETLIQAVIEVTVET